MGFSTGDALMVEVARRLVGVVGPDALAARIAGSQFAVLSRGLDNDTAAELGKRIREAIDAPFEIGGHSCAVSTIVVLALPDESGRLDLMRTADRARQEANIRA